MVQSLTFRNATAGASSPMMRGSAPDPYADTAIGRWAVPELLGTKVPLQMQFRSNRIWSPAAKVRVLTFDNVAQGVAALLPLLWSLPVQDTKYACGVSAFG